jgi:hypothetical protein
MTHYKVRNSSLIDTFLPVTDAKIYIFFSQKLKANLQQHHGYSYNWKLIKEKELLSTTNKRRDEFYVDFFDRITKQTTKSMVKMIFLCKKQPQLANTFFYKCQNIDLIVPSKLRTQSNINIQSLISPFN